MKFQYAGGGAGKGGTAILLADEKEVAKVEVPATLFARISLDETFDVGEDTGTPVVDDYESKMPYAFTGTLKRLGVVLEPENLSPEDQQKLRDAIGKVLMGSH